MNVSRFYGWFKGRAKEITRTGSRDSGITTTLQDDMQQITVTLSNDEGITKIRISTEQSSINPGPKNYHVLFYGTWKDLEYWRE